MHADGLDCFLLCRSGKYLFFNHLSNFWFARKFKITAGFCTKTAGVFSCGGPCPPAKLEPLPAPPPGARGKLRAGESKRGKRDFLATTTIGRKFCDVPPPLTKCC